MANKSNQKNIRQGKDSKVIGRDDNSRVYIYGDKKSPIAHLLEEFRKWEDEVSFVNQKLQKFSTRKRQEILKLEDKLAKKKLSEDTIFNAKEAKEEYAKKLDEFIHSKSAQEIHIHILDDTLSRFNTLIKPNLKELSEGETLEIVHEKIVSHIMDLFPDNYLSFNERIASGALYYLTGNCHINWE